MNSTRKTAESQSPLLNALSEGMSALCKNWQLFLLLLPALVLLIVFRYLPLFGLSLAFKQFNYAQGIFGSPWYGLRHFVDFFSYYRFKEIFLNTVILSLYKLAAHFPLPIILAVALNEVKSAKLKKTVQTVTFVPYFISVVVIVGMMLQLLAPQTGLINNIISYCGGQRINFIGDPANFRHLFVWSDVWQMTGYSAVLYIAALTSVDQSMYEAASIDGVTKWQKIIYIDFPAILPTVIIMFILEVGRIMDVSFEKVILLQNPVNLRTSEVLSTYIYKVGMIDGRFDFATAGTLFNSLINFTLLVMVNRIAKKAGETSLW
jgi:putative aldouronate transport system permease protein